MLLNSGFCLEVLGWLTLPETRCEYFPVSSYANVLLAKVSGGTYYSRRIVRAVNAPAVVIVIN